MLNAPHTAPPLTLAYVVKGFWRVVEARPDMSLDCAEIELMGELIEYANLVETAWTMFVEAEGPDAQWPGVWDYDVSEAFGEWLGQLVAPDGTLPSRSDAIRALLETLSAPTNF
ncbi:MAG: hypothetical protein WC972_02530 [Trueperaceae bacterium]